MDLLEKTWSLSAGRMKAGREHRVPLSARSLAILEKMQPHRQAEDSFVFPGAKLNRPLSEHGISDAVALYGPGMA